MEEKTSVYTEAFCCEGRYLFNSFLGFWQLYTNLQEIAVKMLSYTALQQKMPLCYLFFS
jgi:hypothetical protein